MKSVVQKLQKNTFVTHNLLFKIAAPKKIENPHVIIAFFGNDVNEKKHCRPNDKEKHGKI